MSKISPTVVVVVGLWSAIAQPNDASLRQLYESHRWFELRDVIAGRTAPALYAGAVAAAFNHRDAVKQLNEALRRASSVDEANDIREALINVHMLNGRPA